MHGRGGRWSTPAAFVSASRSGSRPAYRVAVAAAALMRWFLGHGAHPPGSRMIPPRAAGVTLPAARCFKQLLEHRQREDDEIGDRHAGYCGLAPWCRERLARQGTSWWSRSPPSRRPRPASSDAAATTRSARRVDN